MAAASELRARIPDRVLSRRLFSPFPSGGVRNSPGAPAFFLVLAVGALPFGCSRPASEQGRAEAPPAAAHAPVSDVVLVTIDTLRADATGFSGNRKVETPNMDQLAAQGVVFERARASSVVTLPSHATMLTGLYPPEHGVRDNTGFRLDASIPTLATIVRERGWATGAFVAAFPLDSRYGLDRGFETYDDGYAPSAAPGDFAMPERAAPEVVSAALAWWRAQEGR
ncbi:MAG TPA: sulfatase-like hydrolase/transferase, partial [Thermoanaerobaculia bacterium]|nr:sulfatase-like hydrolase/transferase [Thermoanaerobaculia bacterium]